jgi:hypothetical protein
VHIHHDDLVQAIKLHGEEALQGGRVALNQFNSQWVVANHVIESALTEMANAVCSIHVEVDPHT